MVLSIKRLERKDIQKAHLELCNRLSTLLGQIGSNLSALARPFIPHTTSSVSAAMGDNLPPPTSNMGSNRPLYTSDEEALPLMLQLSWKHLTNKVVEVTEVGRVTKLKVA